MTRLYTISKNGKKLIAYRVAKLNTDDYAICNGDRLIERFCNMAGVTAWFDFIRKINNVEITVTE
jgi:hypothetical protein